MGIGDRLYDVDLRAHPSMSTEELLCSLLDQALDVLEDAGQAVVDYQVVSGFPYRGRSMDTKLARTLLSSVMSRGTQARGEIRAMFESREKEVRS